MGTAVGIGIGIGRKRKNWSRYWATQSEVLFFGEISKITDGKLYNQKSGATDYLTVTGSAGSYTFQCPNTAPYITADTDYIWFKTDETPRSTTEAELITYDFTRTIVKYGDVSPNSLEVIMILSSTLVTDSVKENRMRNDFKLSVWWNGITCSDYGKTKDNRSVEKSTWTTEVDNYIVDLVNPVSNSQVLNLNKLVAELKTNLGISGLPEVFCYMHILANKGDELWKRNIIKRNYDITQHGGTVTEDEGWQGNGIDAYLEVDFNPVVDGGTIYTLNNASLGIYSNTDANGLMVDIGSRTDTNNYTSISSKLATGKTALRLHNAVGTLVDGTVADSVGLFIVTRDSALPTHLYGYKNKELLTTTASSNTSSMPNLNIYIGARNYDGTPEQFSTRQYAYAFAGKHITTAMRDIIVDVFNNYLNRL